MPRVISENQLQKIWAIDREDSELPRGATIVGSNGVFHTSNSEIFDIVKKSTDSKLPGLKEIEEHALVTRKIPANAFWVGPRWLYKMWHKNQKKEYIILLFYHPDKQIYGWMPPRQNGSVASLSYAQSEDADTRQKISEGWRLVGTMHNHFGSRGSAFQSGTDKHDEEKIPGAAIHFTMGYMDAPSVYMCEFHTRMVSGKFSQVIPMRDAVEDFESTIELPHEWDDKVKIPLVIASKSQPTVSSIQPAGMLGNKIRNVVGYFGFNEDPSDEEYSRVFDGMERVLEGQEEEEGYYVLNDIPAIVDAPDLSDHYTDLVKEYPKVYKFANGRPLLLGTALLSELRDAIDYCMIDDGPKKPEDYEDIIKDVMTTLETVERLQGEFYAEQQDRQSNSK